MSGNLYGDVLVCEECVLSLSRNAVNFLCQACGTILGVHGKFQDFLNIFVIYLILFQVTT
jgi:hypothetical protein